MNSRSNAGSRIELKAGDLVQLNPAVAGSYLMGVWGDSCFEVERILPKNVDLRVVVSSTHAGRRVRVHPTYLVHLTASRAVEVREALANREREDAGGTTAVGTLREGAVIRIRDLAGLYVITRFVTTNGSYTATRLGGDPDGRVVRGLRTSHVTVVPVPAELV